VECRLSVVQAYAFCPVGRGAPGYPRRYASVRQRKPPCLGLWAHPCLELLGSLGQLQSLGVLLGGLLLLLLMSLLLLLGLRVTAQREATPQHGNQQLHGHLTNWRVTAPQQRCRLLLPLLLLPVMEVPAVSGLALTRGPSWPAWLGGHCRPQGACCPCCWAGWYGSSVKGGHHH
jgi:hypothetical protein